MNNELTIQINQNNVSLVEIRSNPDRFPRLNQTPPDQALNTMMQIVYMAFMYTGRETDVDNIRFIASSLVLELTDDNPCGTKYLSWIEVNRAVKRAVLGHGKEMFGISVASLYQAIINYIKTEGLEADKKAKLLKRHETELQQKH